MGDAKRRKKFDESFGVPEVYTLQVIPCNGKITEEQVADAPWMGDRTLPLEHYSNPTEVLITDQVQFSVTRGRNATI